MHSPFCHQSAQRLCGLCTYLASQIYEWINLLILQLDLKRFHLATTYNDAKIKNISYPWLTSIVRHFLWKRSVSCKSFGSLEKAEFGEHAQHAMQSIMNNSLAIKRWVIYFLGILWTCSLLWKFNHRSYEIYFSIWKKLWSILISPNM